MNRFSCLLGLVTLLTLFTAAAAQNPSEQQPGVNPVTAAAASSSATTRAAKPTVTNLDKLNQYVVSATAGGINEADGDVSSKRGEDNWNLAVVGDQLKSGDRLKTGAAGRAEVLLTPGSYLRLSANTEIRMYDTALDSVRVGLISGSIIVEAASFDTVNRTIATLATPKATVSISHQGVYRLNVDPAGTETVEVERGKLAINGTEVGSGRMATLEVGGTTPKIEKISNKSKDGFDDWSQERAQSLVAANSGLQSPTPLAPPVSAYNPNFGPLLSGFYSPFSTFALGSPGWGTGCGGGWFFDPFLGFSTYLPGFYETDFFGGFYPCYSAAFSGYGFPYRVRGIYRRPTHAITKVPLRTIVSMQHGGMARGVRPVGIARSHGVSGPGHSAGGHGGGYSTGGGFSGGHASSGGGGGHAGGSGGGHR